MKNLLKKACLFSWCTLGIIIILGLISSLSPDVFLFYIKIAKPLTWAFWGLTLISLLLLITVQEKQIKERLRGILTLKDDKMAEEINKLEVEERMGGGLSWLLILLLVIFTGPIVMESYLLIEILAYMWIIILFLIVFAIYRKFKKYTLKEKLFNIHYDFIAALGVSITIFYTFLLLSPFYHSFLTSAKFIDNSVFASAARNVGDNYNDIRKNEIKKISAAAPDYYRYLIEDYTKQLSNDRLTEGLRPHEFQGDKTNHGIFIERAWELLADKTIPKPAKQKIMESLLDYITQLIRKGYFEEINKDEEHKINIILLGKLGDFILQYELDTAKWQCFLCYLKKYTVINVSRLNIPLGDKECEPCPGDRL